MLQKPYRRRQHDRLGAALTEFAIVAPFLFMMLVGMIEFGRTLMVQHLITTAAHEAAREASLPSATYESVMAVAENHLASGNVQGSDIVIDPTPADASPGDVITVTISQPLSTLTTMGTRWFGAQYEIDASSSMRKEGFD